LIGVGVRVRVRVMVRVLLLILTWQSNLLLLSQFLMILLAWPILI